MRTIVKIAIAAVAATIACASFSYYKRSCELITLDVQDMEVRKLCRELERQTGHPVLVQPSVKGNCTIKVSRMPLRVVLRNYVSPQTSSRSVLVYPIYSDKQSLAELKDRIAGRTGAGWSNYVPARAIGGSPESELSDLDTPLSFSFVNKDPKYVAMALSRFGQTEVLLENGVSGAVSISGSSCPPQRAVKTLAAKLAKKWTFLYVLEERPIFVSPVSTLNSTFERMKQERDAALQTMPQEQRKRLEQIRARDMAYREQLNGGAPGGSPSGNRGPGGPGGGPGGPSGPGGGNAAAAGFGARLLNSTPEERVQDYRHLQHQP